MKKTIVCDKCLYTFGLEKIKVRKRTIDKAQYVSESYFRCPNCKAKYTVLVSDPGVRRYIAEGNREAAHRAEATLRARYADKLN